MIPNGLQLQIPDTCECIRPGSKIRLHRFSTECWIVNHGWFEFDGNRPVCGWYLVNAEKGIIKPLLKTDLDDIYLVE